MKIYTCVDHEGHYPVGVSSLVVAENEEAARQLLIQELATHGLKQDGKPFTLRETNVSQPRAYVLQDGNY